MAVRGVKPKENPLHAGRGRVHEWSDVENTPYAGSVPVRLPAKTIRTLPFGGTEELPIHSMTRAWWKAITRMPHCVLWTESDWHFALATALVADRFHVPPELEADHVERVLRLPDGYVCYAPPPYAPPVAKLPDDVVFAAFHNPAKIGA